MDKFHVLIVEDEKTGWAEPMNIQLQKLHSEINCQIAGNMQTATKNLTQKRFHFVSFDQHLPGLEGDSISTKFGVELMNKVNSLNPLISGCIYSAYGRKDPDILISAGKYQLDYLDKAETSAKQWAHYVSDYLQNKYWLSYFSAGTQVLPPPLAEAAGFLKQAEQNKQPGDWVNYYLDFWEATLRLTWAQALGLARHQKISETLSDNWQNDHIIKKLKDLIPKLARQDGIRCWNPYLGAQQNQGWQALTCLDELRRLRNEKVHGKTRGQWSDTKAALQQHALTLTDLAAFWADFPLIHFNEARQAERISGNGYPFPQADLDWEIPQDHTSEHIYITWRDTCNPEDKLRLISLWPYLKLRWDNKLNRSVLCVVSHARRTRQGTIIWYEVNLQNGQQQTFQPSIKEARILAGKS